MDRIENRTFDELQIGEAASLARALINKDIELFALMSGDVNPTHADREFAERETCSTRLSHIECGEAL